MRVIWCIGAFLMLGFVAISSASAQAGAPVAPDAPDAPTGFALDVVSGGLTEATVVARVQKVSPRLESAVIARESALNSATWKAADFAPRLDLQASYMRLSEVEQVPFEFGDTVLENPFPQVLNQYALRARLRVPISDYYLSVLPTYRAAEASAEVARFQVEAEREADALRAREAFLSYVRAVAATQVAEHSVAQLQAHVAKINTLFRARRLTQADVMQARAQLSSATLQRDRLRAAVEVTGASLRTMLRLDAGAPLPIGEDIMAPDTQAVPSRDNLQAQALSQRPEVRGLQHVLAAHQFHQSAAGGVRWPNLSLVANFDYANPNARSILQQQKFSASWEVGLVLAWSPNDFVAAAVQVDEARADGHRAQADLKALEERIHTQITQSISDLKVAKASIRTAEEGVEAATEVWQVKRDLLDAGRATSDDVLDAQTVLFRAQLNLVDARVDVRVARARTQYAAGLAASALEAK